MNNYYNVQKAIEQARKPHTITVSRNSVFTYRDMSEMILCIYWEQLEKTAKIVEREMYKKGAPFKPCSVTAHKSIMTATHMCDISYDLIGVFTYDIRQHFTNHE